MYRYPTARPSSDKLICSCKIYDYFVSSLESPIDVPGHQTAEVPVSPIVKAPVKEAEAVVEEIQQVRK